MIDVEGALRSSVRDELESVGFIPTASKLYRPSPGTVPRSTLLEHVEARGSDVVVVTAPAGYGKSTFLAELAANDARSAAWVSLTPVENDPASFLAYIALALDAIEPVDPGCVTMLWGAPPTIGSPTLQQFGAMFAARRQPFVLVLDDVHELVGREVLDILPMLLAELPEGSRIMLGARTAIPLPLGRLRVRRRLVEIGAPSWHSTRQRRACSCASSMSTPTRRRSPGSFSGPKAGPSRCTSPPSRTATAAERR